VDYVNPFIGTTDPGLRWMLFPGPAMPFGMVKLSPDNRRRKYKAGYDYRINTISGFSHIHSWTMGGLLMMPATGPLKVAIGPESGSPDSFRSHFRHETESASAGYYAVTLDDYRIRAELTSTTRAGFERYTFPKSDQARIMMVLNVPDETDLVVKDARIRKVSATEIEGSSDQIESSMDPTYSYKWQQYKLFFVIRFSKPFDSMGGWVGTNITKDSNEITGKGDVGAFASYHTGDGEQINVKTGISYVSIEQARLNLNTEMGGFGWDFDAVRNHARNTWNSLLKNIQVEGGTEADRTKFYTGLYHSYVARTIFSDVNGKYVDPLGHVQQLKNPDSPMMGCDAFWNTFWNLNQLWGLVTPDILNQWVNSQLEINDRGGWLSKAPGGLRYSGMMVGEHEIALIVSAWQKGVRNFDAERAFQAIKHIQTTPGRFIYKNAGLVGWAGNEELEPYMKFGYVPVEDGRVALTLDYAYDDWCAAQLAKALGKMDEHRYFMNRAQNYRHVYDPSAGYFRPRHRDGTWVKEFSPFDQKDYVEGTAWQYAWYVPHDVRGLIGLMGKDEFIRRLNEGFENSRPDFASEDKYVNVDNQPNMQAPWLFNYAGVPWLTQKWEREVVKHSFGTGPQGYVGDEDQGQMGSYCVMLSMGLFEMDGGCSLKPIYEIGSPLFDRIVIHLDKKYYPGRQFVIETKNNSSENVYIQSATLDGKLLNKPWIYHSDVVKGGTLALVMGSEPNKNWGAAPEAAPPQNED
jgi:predicted alpha-1,2-mannosidase